ncbi:hypothetical protein [Larkinella humicola]|uniref:Uncharacterized protein n=1 Tax=Larkinella humicola TaxID=2607654 RepID=A0A5N1J8X9_9BACT|nr:hypothetical protein [Larkinella humicola]KAA9347935.1 hypothetical protein F0P93_25275 [Larkinella humicola]
MKRILIMVTAVTLMIGGCTTQRPISNDGRYDRTNDRYDRNDDRYGRYDNPNVREIPLENKLERWQNELNLTNRQKREIRNIQDRYERRGLTRNERNDRREYRQLQQQKRKDLLSVLTSRQRDRLYQLEQRNRS